MLPEKSWQPRPCSGLSGSQAKEHFDFKLAARDVRGSATDRKIVHKQKENEIQDQVGKTWYEHMYCVQLKT